MTATGAKYFASWLAGNPPLETLVISGGLACSDARGRGMRGYVNDGVCKSAESPDFGDEGLTAVAEGLQSNSRLTHVDVVGASAWLVVRVDFT